MKITKLSIGLAIAGMLAAAPVLAQTSTSRPQTQGPVFQDPAGVAGGFAGSKSKDVATRQNTQNLSPSSDQDAMASGKQK